MKSTEGARIFAPPPPDAEHVPRGFRVGPLPWFGSPWSGAAFGAILQPMGSTAESVLQHALTLPEEDRAEIATRLIASLDAHSQQSRDDVEEAWAVEIERRCEALDAGTTTTRSWMEVRRRIETDLLRK